ncbi:MAG: hypothetical protein RSE25_05900 [Bacteroidales bacterium]
MRKLIKQIYAEWKSVKERAQKDCENRSLFNMAEKYRECNMLKGTEDIEQIVRLFFSLQGVEFCQKYNFPNIQTLRKFKPYDVERFGVFIDAGRISLNNVRKVILIGDTDAAITCGNNWRYEVIMMHGAKAEITALGWAVVAIENKGGNKVKVTAKDRAKIL